MSYEQELEIKIEVQGHGGWNTMFHRDVVFPLNTPNVIPFRNNLRKEIETIINEKWTSRAMNMKYLTERGTVLRFTYVHRSQATGYRDEIVCHIKMSEEGWRSGLAMFAEKIWRC